MSEKVDSPSSNAPNDAASEATSDLPDSAVLAERQALEQQIQTSKTLLRELLPRLDQTRSQATQLQGEAALLRVYVKNLVSSLRGVDLTGLDLRDYS